MSGFLFVSKQKRFFDIYKQKNRNSMSVDKKFKKLDDISHVILRPGMYIGSIKPHTASKWVVEEGKMTQREITYNPGFLKIFDEIVTNSVDESKREGSKLNIIKVDLDRETNKVTIWDNGGIPVLKNTEHDEWIPEMVFSNLKAGSNFDDTEERSWAGTNGVGSTLTNIYSKEFKISTCDGKNHFTQTFTNNMRERTQPVVKKAKSNHTEISYITDLEKFGLTDIDDDHYKMIEKRIYDIAACNTGLKIYFNGNLININSFEDYIKLYTEEYFYEFKKDKTWSLGIALSQNGFQQVSFANTTETYDGGTHVDYVMNQIIVSLREFFLKKHKVDIKPSELKQHMFLFLDATVINPSFSSQTKEKLITEVKEFGTTFEVSNKLIQSILKSEIVNSILDWIQQKKNAEDSKLQRDLNKKLTKIKVEKLIDAKGKDRWKYSIGLFEGDSAISAFRKYRTPETMGAFALKGKFVNVSEITNQKLVQNDEAVNLMASIGLKLGQEIDVRNLRYGRVLIFTDADMDGNAISALLINFFYKYWPDMFERKMIYKVETPIVVAIPKAKSKKKVLFYTQGEYNTWAEQNDLKQFEIKYKKGLAALVDDEYDDIINRPRLTLITKDEASKGSLETWFGKSADLRKNELLK
jgi:DNA topoisomerase-2